MARKHFGSLSRRSFLQASGLATGLALAACAATPPAETGDEAAMPETTNVVIWTGFGQGRMADAMQGAVDRFGEENPQFVAEHVIVPWGELHNNVITNTAAGTPPDSYRGWAWIVAEDAPIGALTDITDYVQAEGVPEDDYWPATWKQMQYSGRFYAMSISTIVQLWFYNQDRMAKAGHDPETVPGSLEEWEEVGQAMTEVSDSGQIERVGFIPHIPNLDPHNWLGAFGADVWDDESGTVNMETPEVLSLLEWYNGYSQEYGIENIAAFHTAYGGNNFGRNSPEGLYYTGQLAIWQIGTWLYNDVGEYGPDLNFGVTKVPSPSAAINGKPGKLQANLYLVPSGAANVEGGYAFSSFMSSSKWVALNKAVPDSVTPSRISNATDSEVEAASADWLLFARDEILPNAWAVPSMPGVGFMGRQIAEAVDAMAYDGVSPADALAGVQERVQQEVNDKLASA